MGLSIILISYNQEKLILQALESIYHQEAEYKRGKDIQVIIADDASTDQTFNIEKKWVNLRKMFFKDIVLLPSDKHRGINQNYLRALQCVTEKYYRGLSGDDLIADIDFIRMLSEADIYVFSFFTFEKKIKSKSSELGKIRNSYLFWNESVDQLKSYSSVIFPFSIVGLVFKNRFINDDFSKALLCYDYLEDRPCWDYCISQKEISIHYINCPISLYRRTDSSIANPNSNNEFQKMYHKDQISYINNKIIKANSYLDKLSNGIFKIRFSFPSLAFIKFLNPYNYICAFIWYKKKTEIKRLSLELDEKYLLENEKYLKKIQHNAVAIMKRFE